MPTGSFITRFTRTLVASTMALAIASAALGAQTTTGSVRGYVTTADGQPATGATVTATNVANGAARSGVASDRGFYVLTGLVPGEYTVSVRRVGLQPESRRQTVGIGQTIQLDLRLAAVATQLSTVTVTVAASQGFETRTSEVATNVSTAQIAALPTSDRNFLGLASLAPGVRISGEGAEGTTKNFRAGALDASSINVFIDGASQKNDITGSGIAGQDASRGNPFPQNAVQEFRVITQNFKAEYQKASSAIIVATTKSGSNEWHGSVFGNYVNDGFVALDSFQRRNKAANPVTFALQDYRRYLGGLAIGGPLVKNKLFIFGSYEGNNQNRGLNVAFNTIPPAIPAGVASQFASNTGSYQSPFRSNLALVKLNYTASEATNYELSYTGRFETDIRSFGDRTSIESAENVRNKTQSVLLKRSWAAGSQLHESIINLSRWNWDPTPENRELIGLDYQGIGRLGGRDGGQSWVQDRASFRHDYTYSGLQAAGEHIFKLGGNVDHLNYTASKTFVRPPVFRFNSAENFAFPREAQYGTGNPDISAGNNQIGLYMQDDWSPSKQLTFNLGIRWDFESNQFDRKYVTPTQVRADLDSVLRNRGFSTSEYFSDGTQRKAFLGAFQPRAGFSYAIDEAQRTTVFGSFGIFYDRSNFNNGLDERFRLQYAIRTFRFSANGLPRDGSPTIQWDPSYLSAAGLDGLIARGIAPQPEVFLLGNSTKPPVSTQFSGGVRQALGTWRVSATYTNVASKNGFTYIRGNRNADGSCCADNSSNYSAILLSDNNPRTWYQALMLQIDRPYVFAGRGKFNWGVGVAYTHANGRQRGGDLFSLDYKDANAYPKFPTGVDVPNLLVANWILDIPYLWGIQYSGVMRLHSGDPYNIFDFSRGFGPGQGRVLLNSGRPARTNFIVPGDIWGYRNIDMRLRKDLAGGGSLRRVGITADLFNVFNFTNLGCWEGFIPPTPEVNANFGKANCVSSDARRMQLGVVLDF